MQQANPANSAVLNRIIERLAANGKTQKCPMCGPNSWIFGHFVTCQLATRAGTTLNPLGFRPVATNYPTVTVF